MSAPQRRVFQQVGPKIRHTKTVYFPTKDVHQLKDFEQELFRTALSEGYDFRWLLTLPIVPSEIKQEIIQHANVIHEAYMHFVEHDLPMYRKYFEMRGGRNPITSHPHIDQAGHRAILYCDIVQQLHKAISREQHGQYVALYAAAVARIEADLRACYAIIGVDATSAREAVQIMEASRAHPQLRPGASFQQYLHTHIMRGLHGQSTVPHTATNPIHSAVSQQYAPDREKYAARRQRQAQPDIDPYSISLDDIPLPEGSPPPHTQPPFN